jgi:hypothetical protein
MGSCGGSGSFGGESGLVFFDPLGPFQSCLQANHFALFVIGRARFTGTHNGIDLGLFFIGDVPIVLFAIEANGLDAFSEGVDFLSDLLRVSKLRVDGLSRFQRPERETSEACESRSES